MIFECVLSHRLRMFSEMYLIHVKLLPILDFVFAILMDV